MTVNAEMLLVSRTLIGLAVGADSAIATAYIAEFAPSRKRGQLSIIQQWMITVGILASFLIALFIFKVAPEHADGADWRIILGLGRAPGADRGGAAGPDAGVPEVADGRRGGTATPRTPSACSGSRSPRTRCVDTADRIAELEGKKEPSKIAVDARA